MWFFFAFLCAILLSAATVLEKRILTKVHSIDFAVASTVLNLLFCIPFLFLINRELFDPVIAAVIFASAFLAAVSFLLVAKGMRHLEISTVAPLLSLSPGTTSILAFLILGEKLSPLQIAGVVCMIIGSYVLTMQKGKGIFEPVALFVRSHYVQFILFSLLFYSFGALLDRIVLADLGATLPMYMFVFHISVALLYIPIAYVFGGSFTGAVRAFKTSGTDLVLSSLFTVGYRYFQMEALRLAAVGLVSAVKRSSSLFTTLIGGEIFHEKDLGRKLFASVIIILGSIFIVV
jgi:drug/metabolite transporter (DMT)-like permease